jgi:hypothetical protein
MSLLLLLKQQTAGSPNNRLRSQLALLRPSSAILPIPGSAAAEARALTGWLYTGISFVSVANSGSGVVTGVGGLVGDGATNRSGAGDVTGIGSLVGAGFTASNGSVDGIGSLAGAGASPNGGNGSVDGIGSLVGEGQAPAGTPSGSGTVDGVGGLVGQGATTTQGSGEVSGLGGLSGGGEAPGGAVTKVGGDDAPRTEIWSYRKAKRAKARVEKLLAEVREEAPALVEAIEIPQTPKREPDWQAYANALQAIEIRLREYQELLEQDDEDVLLLL